MEAVMQSKICITKVVKFLLAIGDAVCVQAKDETILVPAQGNGSRYSLRIMNTDYPITVKLFDQLVREDYVIQVENEYYRIKESTFIKAFARSKIPNLYVPPH